MFLPWSFTQFSTRINWNWSLGAADFFCMFTQSIHFYTFSCYMLKVYRCLKNKIHQMDRLVASFSISPRFTAKIELVFVLKQENASSDRFHFTANRNPVDTGRKLNVHKTFNFRHVSAVKSIVSSKGLIIWRFPTRVEILTRYAELKFHHF